MFTFAEKVSNFRKDIQEEETLSKNMKANKKKWITCEHLSFIIHQREDYTVRYPHFQQGLCLLFLFWSMFIICYQT